MANQPTDPRWPPGSDIDFQSLLDRAILLKRRHFPDHTARDPADPFIQILRIIAALGQHALHRANHALKQLNPKTATSRRALLALLEVVNRPLKPMIPSRGKVYATLSAAPVISTVMIESGTRIVQSGITDPVFTVDEDVSTGSSVSFFVWHHDYSSDTTTAVTLGVAVSDDERDSWIIGFLGISFDAVSIAFSVPHGGTKTYCMEYYNEEWGSPDSVSDQVTELRFVLTSYLHADSVDSAKMAGLSVTVKYKPTNTVQTVECELHMGLIVAVTTLLGQITSSTSTADYEVYAEWRPVPNQTDGTAGFTASGTLSFSFADLRSETDWWEKHDIYGYAVRMRMVESVSGTVPANVTMSAVSLGASGKHYATASITQGYSTTFTLEQTDGSAFQLIPLTADPIYEPVLDPAITIRVGTDTDWSVVDDFSNSGSASRHAVLREDVDIGWGIMFGDGSIGQLPDTGQAVTATYRTGSRQPGDLDAGVSIKSSSTGLVKSWVLPRGTSGYEAPEASTKEDVLRFRARIVPQLSLRAESVVTPNEIAAALSGGAPNRATFETADGRTPFSRAMYTAEGAGERQYFVIVVGDEDDEDGTVAAADLTEAEEWLNGVTVGVQIVGGHGPQNTQGIVGAFVPRTLLPTITVTTPTVAGVREQVDQVIRSVLKPHARDDAGDWRWEFGGLVPVAVLFGRLWDSLPGRDLITISISDGTTVYGIGDSIALGETELPVLDSTYDSSVNITVVES